MRPRHSGDRGLVEGVDLLGQFLAEMPEKAAEAARAAAESAVPATVGAGTGECNININRRPADTDGRLFTGRNWNGYVDPEVLVLGFDDAEREANCDGPPLRLPPDRFGAGKQVALPRLSRPRARGWWRKQLEGLCLFLQGSAGNQGPVHGFVGDVEVARKQGKILGLAAAAVRMQIDPFQREERLIEIVPSGADLGMYEDIPVGEPDGTLRVANRYIDLPAGDFPPEDEARQIADEKQAELLAAREGGDDATIKAAVMAAKRANFTVTNAQTAHGGTVNIRVQAMRHRQHRAHRVAAGAVRRVRSRNAPAVPRAAHGLCRLQQRSAWVHAHRGRVRGRAATKSATPRCARAQAKRP